MGDYELDPCVWHACSGLALVTPILSSTVYYFPQAHVASYTASPSVQALCSEFPRIRCNVVSMKLLADPHTDEVFSHAVLQPMLPHEIANSVTPEPNRVYTKGRMIRLVGSEISIRCQIFTGGDPFFRKQDREVVVRDVHNREWRFGHIYDDSHSCHNLTWNHFFATKNLSPGDSVLFLRDRSGMVTVGIRRAQVRLQRIGKGLSTAETIGAQLVKALRYEQFEAAYYPTLGASYVFYDTKSVEASLEKEWVVGVNVSKCCFIRLTKYLRYGIITAMRPLSTWKAIQVKWDNEELQESTNPWEIEIITRTVDKQKRILCLFGQNIELEV